MEQKKAIVENLYTSGEELQRLNGDVYVGRYHILIDGTTMSGATPKATNPEPEILYGVGFLPVNQAGELISVYNENTPNNDEDFEGTYTTMTIKSYKNDIDVVEEQLIIEKNPPSILIQPDLYFRKNIETDYTPGKEIFIDESRNIQIAKGQKLTLEFGYLSEDTPDNILFSWTDSFDRVVSSGSILEIDTNTINWEQETFSCTITDTYGSDVTNDINVNIIDINNNAFLLTNVLKNGSGNDGTSEWDSNGDAPEEVGKFLAEWQSSNDGGQDGIDYDGRGTYYYHKFSRGWDSIPDKNQWYPRPELFDALNGFSGSVASEIKESYFRGGIFYPVVNTAENNYSGLVKTSVQVVDLTDAADIISGKVYGIAGAHVCLFGWLGARADQSDRIQVTMECLDENDQVLPVPPQFNLTISNLASWQRTANEYTKPWYTTKNTYIYTGYNDLTNNFDYTGIIFDGNVGIFHDRFSKDFIRPDGSILNLAPEIKTCIVGRTTDMIILPPDTKKIRVTKKYNFSAGLYDIFWEGKQWADKGDDYISEAMAVGLNIRLYPRIVDTNTGDIINLGLNSSGNSIIKGLYFLESIIDTAHISLLAQSTLGNQALTDYFEGQNLRFHPTDGITAVNNFYWDHKSYWQLADSSIAGADQGYLEYKESTGLSDVMGTPVMAYLNNCFRGFVEDQLVTNNRDYYVQRRSEVNTGYTTIYIAAKTDPYRSIVGSGATSATPVNLLRMALDYPNQLYRVEGPTSAPTSWDAVLGPIIIFD